MELARQGTAQTEYNLLLTTCAVLHRRYFELYMSPLLARARVYVEVRIF